jgi:hypothetical protein
VAETASVAALKKAILAKLKLDISPGQVVLRLEGAKEPLDSKKTVREALGEALDGRPPPGLIVEVLETKAKEGAWSAASWASARRRAGRWSWARPCRLLHAQ